MGLPDVLAVLTLAGLLWLVFGRTLIDYDIAWALIWGDELAGGQLPSYESRGAPTPHPLATLAAFLASPLGTDGAYAALLLLAFVGYGVLVWSVFRLGQSAFAWPVGAVGALAMATSFPLLQSTLDAFLDVSVAALVVVAAVLEARQPRRGTPVLVLLAVAGLQRPEIWLLSGAYWLYLAPSLSWRKRAATAALAVAAPVLWILSDFAITGDPLLSFDSASSNAFVVEGDRMVPDLLRSVLRLPVLVGAAGGLVLALTIARSRARVPAALAIVGVAAVGLVGAAGLDLLARFLLAPAAALSVLFGYAVAGWMGRERGLPRTVWAVAGAVLLFGSVASARNLVDTIRGMPTERERLSVAEADLRSLTREAPTRETLRGCAEVAVPTGFLVPYVAYYLDRDSTQIIRADRTTSRSLAFLTPVGRGAKKLQERRPFAMPAPEPPSGFSEAGGNRSWQVYSRSC